MSYRNWLPPRIELNAYGGNWSLYLDAIYTVFKGDFVNSKPLFRGVRLGLKKHPLRDGKECTFWHFISKGSAESIRTPNLSRCERIPWARPTIEHESDSSIKIWENKRRNEDRILIYLEPEAYLVILAKRKGYLLPWTAYIIEQEHRRRKLLREYEAYIKKAGTSS